MKEPYIGGQAVIEGVMMRSPSYWAVAVRLPQGNVEVKSEKQPPLSERYRLMKVPVLRGAGTLIQMLYLGMRALSFSADKAMEEEEKQKTGKAGSASNKLFITLSILFAFALGILLFIWLPLVITSLILSPPGSFAEVLAVMQKPQSGNTLFFNLLDGVIRLLIFVAYVAALNLWKDFRRVFQYHGAEHKTIHAYEKKDPLTVDNVRKYSTLHPRCGTSFLFVVMIVSILIFSLVRSDLFVIRFLSRIVLLPVIAGIGYEIIRFSARHLDNALCRFCIKPGLWLQKLTTKEPTDDMLEVAIGALKTTLSLEKHGQEEMPQDQVFVK